MKQLLFASLLAFPIVGFCQYTSQNLQVNFLETETAAKKYTYQNLRLYPIYAKSTFTSHFKNLGNYMSLQDALQKNKVRITENSEGGTVQNLLIENISKDTIIIICGDIVKGGKQDRIVQEDLLLKPKSGKKDLKVFCVESGRWDDGARRGNAVNRSSRQAPVVQPANFSSHYNKGAMGLRKVVEKEKDQSKVWSKVDEINTVNMTVTSTKTYTSLNNSADYAKKLAAYIKFFKNKFDRDSSVIGVVVVSGNRVLGCDMFATNQLFKTQYQSLLHSYVTEAILKGKPVTATAANVKAYMNPLLSDEKTQQLVLKEKGNAFISQGKKLRVSGFE